MPNKTRKNASRSLALLGALWLVGTQTAVAQTSMTIKVTLTSEGNNNNVTWGLPATIQMPVSKPGLTFGQWFQVYGIFETGGPTFSSQVDPGATFYHPDSVSGFPIPSNCSCPCPYLSDNISGASSFIATSQDTNGNCKVWISACAMGQCVNSVLGLYKWYWQLRYFSGDPSQNLPASLAIGVIPLSGNYATITDFAQYDIVGAPCPPPDLIAVSLAWDSAQGGADFQYKVAGGSLTNDTTAELYWARGTTTNDIIAGAPAIFTNAIPAGASGLSATNHVPANAFTNPPPNAQYVLLFLDPNYLVPEANKTNNVMAVAYLDLVTNSLAWDTTSGGIAFAYGIRGIPTPAATTAKLFWASGTTTNDIIQNVPGIFTNPIPLGASGPSGTIEVPFTALANPATNAAFVLLVLDPQNLLTESEKDNNVQALQIPDLATNSLAWNVSTGGIDFSYSVNPGPLNRATTAQLFWASGMSTNDVITNAPGIFTQAVAVAVSGPSQPIHVPIADFSSPPPDAAYVLLVLDPNNLVLETNKDNNVQALAIPDLVTNSLQWDIIAGADFSYSINWSPLGTATAAELFWATGTNRNSIIQGAAAFFTNAIAVDASGDSGNIQVPLPDFAAPPTNASYVLLVLDPDNLVVETNKNNNVEALAIPDLVTNSLTWDPKNAAIDFSYSVKGAPLGPSTYARLYWATGKTTNTIIHSVPVIYSLTIPVGAFGASKTNAVPAATFGGAPSNATNLLLVLDPDNLVVETSKNNNVQALPLSDLITNTLVWDGPKGGVDFNYVAARNPPGVATTAKLFWASGPTTNDIIRTVPAIFTNAIAASFSGTQTLVSVSSSFFTNAPTNTTYVMLVLDPDHLVWETDRSNNAQALAITNLFSGHVYCTCDSNAIPEASVEIGQYSTMTDKKGAYKFTDLPPGTYQAVVKAANYATLTTTVTNPAGVLATTTNLYLTNLTLVVNPIYLSSITSDPRVTGITNAIKAAAQVYEKTIANPLCVSILFSAGTDPNDIATSLVDRSPLAYSQYLADLKAIPKKSASVSTALASLPPGPGTGINGNTEVLLTPANLAAIGEKALAAGIVQGSGGFYGEIELNFSMLNISRPNLVPALNDLQSTTLREINEVLGIGGQGSAMELSEPYAGQGSPANGVGVMDLFRFGAPDVRSFTMDPSATAYFSINGGANRLVYFNQLGYANGSSASFGDWGDGVSPADGKGNTPPQVQDAFGGGGAMPDLGANELIALDVIGYTLVATPPAILGVAVSQDTFSFAWTSVPGQAYQVQYAPDLSGGSWTNLGGQIVASGVTTGVSDTNALGGTRFYQVLILAGPPASSFLSPASARLIPEDSPMTSVRVTRHYRRAQGYSEDGEGRAERREDRTAPQQ